MWASTCLTTCCPEESGLLLSGALCSPRYLVRHTAVCRMLPPHAAGRLFIGGHPLQPLSVLPTPVLALQSVISDAHAAPVCPPPNPLLGVLTPTCLPCLYSSRSSLPTRLFVLHQPCLAADGCDCHCFGRACARLPLQSFLSTCRMTTPLFTRHRQAPQHNPATPNASPPHAHITPLPHRPPKRRTQAITPAPRQSPPSFQLPAALIPISRLLALSARGRALSPAAPGAAIHGGSTPHAGPPTYDQPYTVFSRAIAGF